jgi:transposase
LEARRRRAIALLAAGQQPVEVARQLGVDRRSVRRWHAAYRQEGEDGVKARPAPGAPSKLTADQQIELVQHLLAGAEASGYPTDLWTCPRVADLIWRAYGVRYHVDHVGRLLHGLGFSPQRPERRAMERDEEAIQQWVGEDWPRLRKERPG